MGKASIVEVEKRYVNRDLRIMNHLVKVYDVEDTGLTSFTYILSSLKKSEKLVAHIPLYSSFIAEETVTPRDSLIHPSLTSDKT